MHHHDLAKPASGAAQRARIKQTQVFFFKDESSSFELLLDFKNASLWAFWVLEWHYNINSSQNNIYRDRILKSE